MTGKKILMHGNDPVALLSFEKNGYLKQVKEVYNEKVLPPGVKDKNIEFDIQRWIMSRQISTLRKDIGILREFYGSEAFQSEMGLSLYDTYWFSTDNKTDWEEVNAYDNWTPDTDSVFIMLIHPEQFYKAKKESPNLTIPGNNEKLWYKVGNSIVLLHGNAREEMMNYKKANFDSIYQKRTYVILSNKIYTMTSAQTSKKVERITLENLYVSTYDQNKTQMENLEYTCKFYDIPYWAEFLERLGVLNEKTDISYNIGDIGVLRETDTLKIIGFCKL